MCSLWRFFFRRILIDGTNATHLPRWWRAHLPRWWRAQRTRERTPGAPPHPNLTFPHWRAQRAPTPPPSFQPFVDSKDRQERRKSPSWVSSQNCPEWDGAGGKSPKPGSRQQLVALSQTRTHVATRAQGSQGSKGPSARTLRCCPVQQPFWQLPLRDRAPHRCCQSWKEARGTLLWTVLPHS